MRLPNGKLTDNQEEYFSQWDAIRLPLESKLGLRTIGYDPSLLMFHEQTNSAIDLPVCLAKQIIRNLK